MSLRLGDIAPNFTQESSEGNINFYEFLGDSWGILFSHPADYTPVCTTELGYTAKLKDEFEKRGVKATFFLLGEEVKQYPDVVRRMHDDGHLIGVHSYKHVNFKEVGTACTLQQIEKTQKAIYDVTGEYAGYIRPPYGCWQKELDAQVNLIEVLWDVDPRDWATTDADTVVQRVLKDTKPGDIILLHDASASSVQAAFTVIDTLQKQGYSFVTVEELLLE